MLSKAMISVSLVAAILGISIYSRSVNVVTALQLNTLAWTQWPLTGRLDDSKWDIMYHLGGNSPWIPKKYSLLNESTEAPAGCFVDQIHMMSRHAERYPTLKAGTRMLELYHRIKHAHVILNDSLAFVNNWEFFSPEPSAHFEGLVSTGPYAGTLEAFASGVRLRTRFKNLLDEVIEGKKTSFWASGSQRVIDTARYFAVGFFGIDWENVATLKVIPETSGLGADTLTPGDTCLNYADNVGDQGHDYGANMLAQWKATYIPHIIHRLAQHNPEIPVTIDEVYTMQEICGFETIAKGRSQWCAIFTHDEWRSFEYARDLLHYYRAGPGNPYGAAMGWLWLNATKNLIRRGPDAGTMFLSFAHDGDIVPLLAALQLLPQIPDLPISRVLDDRTWRLSDVVPMGGRVILERLTCLSTPNCWDNGPLYPNHVYCEEAREETYVRVDVNDGIVALPGCDGGPGSSCPLEQFQHRVENTGQEAGEFRKLCGLSDESAKQITFLHQ